MRYFAGNTLASFQRSKGTVVEVTTAGTFDSAYVPSAISIPSPDAAAYFDSPTFNASPVEFWYHCELHNPTGAGDRITFFNGATGVYRLDVNGSSTTGRIQYWNGSAWTTITTFGFSGATLYRLDIQIVLGASGSMTVYNQETTVLATGALGAGAATTITKVRCSGNSNSGTALRFSQMFAEDSDTRGKKYMQAALNALGSYTDGSGAVGDINETVLNDATLAQLTGVGNKRSFTHSGITVPAGFTIGASVASARARVGGGTVTNGKLGIDSGATYSGGANLNPGTQLGPINRIDETDPDTALAWTEAGFDAAEIVLEAA